MTDTSNEASESLTPKAEYWLACRRDLTSIVGYIDLLLEGVNGQLSKSVEFYLKRVKSIAWKLLEFIDNIAEDGDGGEEFQAKADYQMRTLLASVLGYSEIQLEETANADPSTRKIFPDLKRIHDAGIELQENAVNFLRQEGGTGAASKGQVFISYSHSDRRWLEGLLRMLTPLIRRGRVVMWDDSQIQPGQRWKAEIKKALAKAKIAVLLVSDNFLASEFIAEHELPPLLNAAKDRGLVIIWVCLTTCLYDQTEIKDYQAAHNPDRPLDMLRPAKRRKILAQICRKIESAVHTQQ